MSEVAEGGSLPRRSSPLAWFINPYLQIAIGGLLVTTAEVLLKKGAGSMGHAQGISGVLGYFALASGWTWLGIISYVLSLVSWLHVLRFVPLSIAFPLINVVHVLVPLGAFLFLGEHISSRRWIGISLIVLGALAILKPLIKAEEKL